MIIEGIFLGALLLLLYTYFIYSAIAVVIGAGRIQDAFDSLTPVSLLVPAHNEAAVIEAKIQNFKALDYPSDLIELLIADDGSSDNTTAVVKRYVNGRIRLLKSDEREGKAAMMNRLVEAAKYPHLLFSDANVMFSKNAVRRMVEHLGSPQVGAITGEVRLVESDENFGAGELLYYELERRIQVAESRIGSVMGVDGGMYLIRRDQYQPIPVDTILDDFLVSMNVMRKGKRVIYESAAKATECGTPTAAQEFARRSRIAAGAVQLLKRFHVPKFSQPVLWIQFVSHKLLRWCSPLLLMALFASNLLILDRGTGFQIVFAAQAVLYSLILLASILPGFRRLRPGAILYYFGISQLAIMIGLFNGLLNRQPALWKKEARRHSQESTATKL